ncbi:hypothetical protein [Desulfonema ishimotonii]|nr:hypothetical protein [Desulfonema ishimotonii]
MTHYKDSPYAEDKVFHIIKDRGRVYDGNWDTYPCRFSDLKVFKALERRIRHGAAWEDTAFYHQILGQIESGEHLWGCENRSDWDARCCYLDVMIRSIRDEGYKLMNKRTFHGGEEVTVNVGRHGQFLFQDGRHRLAIARILGIEKIPVRILVRHRQWQTMRENLTALAKKNDGPKPRQDDASVHPDLADIPGITPDIFRFFTGKEDHEFTG